MLKTNPYGAALRLAIRNTLTPDSYTVVPAAEVVEAIALSVELQAAVSNARRPEYANNPWLTSDPFEQLTHGHCHCEMSIGSLSTDQDGRIALDSETGLPHIGHALLRLSFAFARLRGVGDEAEHDCTTCGEKHAMTSACRTACPCEGCKNFNKWVRND